MEGEIIFRIDVMLARRKMSVTELSERVGITMANISILKNGKAKNTAVPINPGIIHKMHFLFQLSSFAFFIFPP